MTKYHKIETLYNRDAKTFKVVPGAYRLPVFELLSDARWVWTEKLDGTNVRVIYENNQITFAGRTDNAQFHPELFSALQSAFTVNNMMAVFGNCEYAVLYGEGVGAKIQGGKNYCDGHMFVMFDAFVNGVWLNRDDVVDVSNKLDISVVPVVMHGRPSGAAKYISSPQNSVFACRQMVMEGLVGRPVVEIKTKTGERVIAKLKTKDFSEPL